MRTTLGRRTDQRDAMLKSQVSELLWYGKIETTVQKAKETKRIAEKIITLAMKTYEDTAEATKEKENLKGQKVKVKFTVDGPKKLVARRKIMAQVADLQVQRVKGEKKSDFEARKGNIASPLVEKIFNVYAPKYKARAEELKQGGGYTRILKTGMRRGDNAETAILELI